MDVRMLKPMLPLLMLVVSAPSVAPCASVACRCISPEASGLSFAHFVQARRDRAERVILGTVTRLDTLARTSRSSGDDVVQSRPVVARIRVRRVWRGPVTDTMTVMVTTTGSRSSCDLEMRPGEGYLIFASRTEGGLLSTRQCTGTETERGAAEALSVLGAGEPAAPRRE